MARTVEYHLKGKSDVEQVTGRAQKSMSQLNTTMAAVNKKFSEIGKDLFMRFLAPVLLIDKAFSMLTDSIKKMTATAEEGIDSIKNSESMIISPEIEMTAEHIKKLLKARKDSEQFREEMRRLTASAFEETKVGQDYLAELRSQNMLSYLMNPLFTSQQMAGNADVQIELARRIAASLPQTTKKPEAKTDFKLEATGGNVIGVGQSAVVLAVQETNDLLRQVVANTTPITGVLNPTGALSKAEGEAAVRMMSTGVDTQYRRLPNR